MLDDWCEKLYPKIYKKPCFTCIVKAKCLNTESWKRPYCEIKNKWRQRQYNITTFLNNVEMWFCILMFVVAIAVFLTTFGFGLWKWYEIIKSYIT